MSILLWLFLGLIAGYIASKAAGKGGAPFLDVVVGIMGALIGGSLFSTLSGVSMTDFSIWSPVVAVVGAIVALLLYHAASRRRRNL